MRSCGPLKIGRPVTGTAGGRQSGVLATALEWQSDATGGGSITATSCRPTAKSVDVGSGYCICCISRATKSRMIVMDSKVERTVVR